MPVFYVYWAWRHEYVIGSSAQDNKGQRVMEVAVALLIPLTFNTCHFKDNENQIKWKYKNEN